MTKLKLGPITEEKPVKATLELPASLHRDLAAYAELLGRQTGQPVRDPVKLIVPMLERFIATDRGFAKARRRRILDQAGPQVPGRQRGVESDREAAGLAPADGLGGRGHMIDRFDKMAGGPQYL
jgi:hypothetical protein